MSNVIRQNRAVVTYSGASSVQATFGSALKNPSLIVAMVTHENSSNSITSVSDDANAGNYTQDAHNAGSNSDNAPGHVAIYSKQNTATSAVTVTASFSGSSYGVLKLYELLHAPTSNAVSASANGTAESAALSLAITPTTDDCSIFSVATFYPNDVAVAADAGFTAAFTNTALFNMYHFGEYRVNAGAAATHTLDYEHPANTYWSAVAVAYKTNTDDLASDDFNRANGVLGGNWTHINGALEIVGNEVSGNSNLESFSYHNVDTYEDDQFAELTITSLDNSSGQADYIGVSVRNSGSPGSHNTIATRVQAGSGSTANLQIYQAGTRTLSVVGTGPPGGFAVGDVMRLEVDGSGASTEIRIARNGEVFYINQNPSGGAPSSGSPGVASFRTTNGACGDDWVGGNLNVASGGGISGSLDSTLAAATLSATGALNIQGSLTQTLDAATLSATATLSLSGSADVTLDDATLSATGALQIQASADVTLDDATLVATGVGAGRTGEADITLDDATLSAAGVLPIRGAAVVVLEDATLQASEVSGPPAARGGDDAPPYKHRGWNQKRAKLKLKADAELTESIRAIYRDLTTDPATRERAQALVSPTKRNDESPAQFRARSERAQRLNQLSVETEIALRMLHQELQEIRERDDEQMMGQLLAMVL